MSSIDESLNRSIQEYRDADNVERKVKQAIAAIEVIKWQLLIEKMDLIDKEVV
jgi:hypothetical protein